MSLPIIKVCLIGANGTLGPALLQALVFANCFDVSVLSHSTSSYTPPTGITSHITVSPEFTTRELVAALRGQDAVIAAFPLKDVDQHVRLVEAAFEAGVRRFIPAEFTSCDARSAQAQINLQMYRDMATVRTRCEYRAAVAEVGGLSFSWTSIVCGHFFDHGLASGLLHFNLGTRTAQILDTGAIKASMSTLCRVAEATIKVLQNLDGTRNRPVYIQSFCLTQLEVLASLERITGHVWHAQHVDSNAYLGRAQRRLESGDRAAVDDVSFVLGTVDADWTLKREFAMELLGLEDEKLDEVVAEVLAAQGITVAAL